MMDPKGAFDCSAFTTSECEIIVYDPREYKRHLYADHKSKKVLADRCVKLRQMSAFKLLADSQIANLAADFTGNEYLRKTTIVDRGDPFDKIVVVLEGDVDIVAYVEDPLCQDRVLTVLVATAGPGSFVGDLERVRGRAHFSYRIVALSNVKTAEMPADLFDKNIFTNKHCVLTASLISSGVAAKETHHALRIGNEMRKFCDHSRRMEKEKEARRRREGGDPTENLVEIKGEWEKEYKEYVKKHMIVTRVRPHYDVIRDKLFVAPSYNSPGTGNHEGRGYKVTSRKEKRPNTTNGERLPETLRVEVPPSYVSVKAGMRVGSAAGGTRTRETEF